MDILVTYDIRTATPEGEADYCGSPRCASSSACASNTPYSSAD